MRAVLAQLPVPSFLWPRLDANVPLAAGYLAAWARRRAPAWEVEVLPWREADLLGDEALVAALLARQARVVGLSAYLWQSERSAWVARRLTDAGVTVLLGGPEVLPDNEWLWQEGGFAAGVAGEGEEAFSRALEAIGAGRPLASVPGLLLPPDGRRAGLSGTRLDLSRMPSPYVAGLLGPSPDGSIWLETVRGCPRRCAYCHYGKRFDRPAAFPDGWLAAHLAWAAGGGVREVYLMDPAFNARGDWEAVLKTLEAGNAGGELALHTELVAERLRPGDASRLARAGLRSCEVGLQSVRAAALAAVGRPWDRAGWLRGAGDLLAAGVRVTVGLIAGLPGDDLGGFAESLEFVRRELPGADLQVFPLALLPGTELRARAGELGLVHHRRPPHTVVRTPGFAPEDLDRSFTLFEEATGLELDPLGPPPLGGTWEGGEDAPYLSGVRLHLPAAAPGWVERVAPRAARHLTVWLRGWREGVDREVAALAARLPHGVLTVVLDDEPGWPPERLGRLLGAGTGEHLLDRTYRHLYGPGARLVPRLVAVVPAAQARLRPRWVRRLAERADVVWRLEARAGWEEAAERLARRGERVWVEGPVGGGAARELGRRLGEDREAVAFSDVEAQAVSAGEGSGGFRAAEHRLTLP